LFNFSYLTNKYFVEINQRFSEKFQKYFSADKNLLFLNDFFPTRTI